MNTPKLNDPKDYPKAGDIVLPALDSSHMKEIGERMVENQAIVPQPSPGRSQVNEELKRIWRLNDEEKEISNEDLKYISDYYHTQAAYWESKLLDKEHVDMYDNPLRDCAKERQELAWCNEALRQDNAKLTEELNALKDSYGFVR